MFGNTKTKVLKGFSLMSPHDKAKWKYVFWEPFSPSTYPQRQRFQDLNRIFPNTTIYSKIFPTVLKTDRNGGMILNFPLHTVDYFLVITTTYGIPLQKLRVFSPILPYLENLGHWNNLDKCWTNPLRINLMIANEIIAEGGITGKQGRLVKKFAFQCTGWITFIWLTAT